MNTTRQRTMRWMWLLPVVAVTTVAHGEEDHSQAYIPHPTVKQIESGLKSWQSQFPQRIDVQLRGRSTEGRPLLLANITDETTADEDKQVVLLSATHTGSELNACTTLLHAIKWLLSGDDSAAEIRRRMIVLVMPCLNPDRYDSARELSIQDLAGKRNLTPRGHNVYHAFTREAVKKDCPEAVALAEVAEHYQPDAALDVHGVWIRGSAMWESTAFSWGDFRAHSYVPRLAEAMNAAAEAQGFFIVRPDEYSGRIKMPGRGGSYKHHYYYINDNVTVMTYLYHKYHTLAINCEVGYEESGVARIRATLEQGLKRWPTEVAAGYPNTQIQMWVNTSIAAWGDTAAKRRRSRVELWRKSGQMIVGGEWPQFAYGKIAGCCVTRSTGARWAISKGSDDNRPVGVGANYREHPRINAEYIEDFFRDTQVRRMGEAAEPSRTRRYMAYNPEHASDEPIEHGMAMRLMIPYDDATILDARLDGHPAEPSATDGYQVSQGPGTVVQFNIPPGKVEDFHIVTCRYESPTKRRQGFTEEDWDVSP